MVAEKESKNNKENLTKLNYCTIYL